MNREQIMSLLAKVQAFDNRTVTDLQVTAWLGVLGGTDYGHAMTYVDEHFSGPHEYLMPHHVIGGARKLGRAAEQLLAAVQYAAIQADQAGGRSRTEAEQVAFMARLLATFEEGRDHTRKQELAKDPYGHAKWCNTTHIRQSADEECPAFRPAGKGKVAYIPGHDRQRGDTLIPLNPAPTVVYEYPGRHACGWVGCVCTHTGGCEGGWMEVEDESGYAKVKACPVCAPQREHILANAKDGREAQVSLRSDLRQYR